MSPNPVNREQVQSNFITCKNCMLLLSYLFSRVEDPGYKNEHIAVFWPVHFNNIYLNLVMCLSLTTRLWRPHPVHLGLTFSFIGNTLLSHSLFCLQHRLVIESTAVQSKLLIILGSETIEAHTFQSLNHFLTLCQQLG